MKRFVSLLLVFALTLALCACGKKTEETATWQEQYDLGIRYLSEGNYEQAILAFEAAIEIDPKSADAYTALADAYLSSGSYEKAAQVLAQGRSACGELEAFDRVEQSADFLQSGDTGIMITDFYFDKAAYLAEQETEFLVSVAYRCPEGQDCILMIGANTDEPTSYRMMEEDIPVSGSGGNQFHVNVAPVQWENSYFGIYVNLSEADHAATWTPFGSDTLYITPDGIVLRSNLVSGSTGGASTGGSGIMDPLSELLYRPGALTYADLPELFFRPCDQLGDLIGCQLKFEGALEDRGGYFTVDSNGVTHEADYTLPVRQLGYAKDLEGDNYASITFGMAYAPESSDQLLRLEMEAFGGGDGACSVGWKEIWLGDTYADVLEKLGLDAQVLEEYFYFNVYLSEDGRMDQISADEINPRTRGFRIGFVSSQYINRGGDYTISFEFEDGVHLTHVRYRNFRLLVELTAGSATEPTPAPTPAGPNTPVPEPTPTPQSDLSRTERMELGDGGYILTEYNHAGQIVSQAFYNADGSVSSRFTKEYDSAGNQIRVTNYGVDGSYSVSEYDANGKLTRTTRYFADGTVDYSYGSEYDTAGRLTKNIWYYADGTVKEVSEFDAGGNEIRRTTYLPDGTVDTVLEF